MKRYRLEVEYKRRLPRGINRVHNLVIYIDAKDVNEAIERSLYAAYWQHGEERGFLENSMQVNSIVREER